MSNESIHQIKPAWHTASFIYPKALVAKATLENLDKAFIAIANDEPLDKLEINQGLQANEQLRFTAGVKSIRDQIKVDLSSPLNRYFGRLNFRLQKFIYEMKQWIGKVVGHEANGAVKEKLQTIQEKVTSLIPGKAAPEVAVEGTLEEPKPTRRFRPGAQVQNLRAKLPHWVPWSTKVKPEPPAEQTAEKPSAGEPTDDSASKND
jgi:hypothetical protein